MAATLDVYQQVTLPHTGCNNIEYLVERVTQDVFPSYQIYDTYSNDSCTALL